MAMKNNWFIIFFLLQLLAFVTKAQHFTEVDDYFVKSKLAQFDKLLVSVNESDKLTTESIIKILESWQAINILSSIQQNNSCKYKNLQIFFKKLDFYEESVKKTVLLKNLSVENYYSYQLLLKIKEDKCFT